MCYWSRNGAAQRRQIFRARCQMGADHRIKRWVRSVEGCGVGTIANTRHVFHWFNTGARKSAAARNSPRRVTLSGLIARQPDVAATWGKQRWIEERWAWRLVCTSRRGTRHVQSGSSDLVEIDVFGRNLRDRVWAGSHLSHHAKKGTKVRADVAAFGINEQKVDQCNTVHPAGLTK